MSVENAKQSLPSATQVDVITGKELEVVHVSGDGDDSSPPVVFIHGSLANLWNPCYQLAGLQGDVEMITYSLAGTGDSDGDGTQSFEQHLRDLRAVVTELDSDVPPVLHGWSYGSCLAVEYAREYPVSGVVSLGGIAETVTGGLETLLNLAAVEGRLAGTRLFSATIRRCLLSLGVSDATSDERRRAVVNCTPIPERRSAWLLERAFYGYSLDEQITLDCPVAVIAASDDEIVSVSETQNLADKLLGSVDVEIDRAGHMVPIERPQVYTILLAAFLDDCRAGRQTPTEFRDAASGLGGMQLGIGD